MRRIFTSVVVLLLVAAPAMVRADEPTPEAKAAAMDLLGALHMDTVLSGTINQVLDMQTQQNPSIARFKPVMAAFFAKYMSWDALKDDMANLYASEFTVDELKQLTEFFKSPVGQKMASKQNVLMAKGAALGQKRVQDHMAELQAAIQDEMKKSQ